MRISRRAQAIEPFYVMEVAKRAAALARELEEELGVRAQIGPEICRTRHKYAEHAREIELLFFTAELESAEVQNLAFERIVWEEAARLPAYDFLAADRDIVERLAKGELALESDPGRA